MSNNEVKDSEETFDESFVSDVGKLKSIKKNYRRFYIIGGLTLVFFIIIFAVKLLLPVIFSKKNNEEVKKTSTYTVKDLDISKVNMFVNDDEKDNIGHLDNENENENEHNEQSASKSVSNLETEKTKNIDKFSNNKSYISKSTGSMVIKSGSNDREKKIDNDELDFMDSNKTTSLVKASFLSTDPTFLLQRGTYINCELKTKLVTTVAGNLGCIISDDVYSANGQVLLIEKGSTAFGTYKSGQIKAGQNRLFVIWNEIRTPNHITIPIQSESTDQLGGGGIEGWVDNHWLERYGSSILLSAITDTTSALADRLRKNDVGVSNSIENTRETANDIATKALEKMIDIENTLYRNHGDIVGIYVNKDIDFSNVYKLEQKK